MIRRNRPIGRWLLVLTLGLTAFFAKDVWLKMLLIARAQAITGAQVDVGKLKANWSSGEVQLGRLQLADPHQPLRNLLQAEQAVLVLDRAQALRGQIVVDHGYLHQLQLGTQREFSGKLGLNPSGDPQIRLLSTVVQQQLEQVAKTFLDRVVIEHELLPPAESQLQAVADEIRLAIPRQFSDLLEQARTIAAAIGRLNDELQRTADNPLREPERRLAVAAEVLQWEGAAQDSWSAAQNLPAGFSAELERLTAARAADLEAAHCRLTAANLQPELLRQLLVSPEQLAQVDEAVRWAQWVHASIPATRDDFEPLPPTGVDVQYRATPLADLQIRALEFEGLAVLGKRSLPIRGQLKNWTYPPFLGGQPIRIELQTGSGPPRRIVAEIESRHEVRVDHVRIQQPATSAPDQAFGKAGVVQIAAGPSRESCAVDLTIEGEQIRGTVRFQNSEATLQMAACHAQAGGAEMKEYLNSALADVRQFETVFHLSGRLNRVQVRCESQLADCLAEAADEAAGLPLDISRSAYPDQLAGQYAAALESLSAEFARQHADLLAALQTDHGRLAQLGQQTQRAGNTDSFRR